jgi:DNA invertase Pin-like site-specific DNA recombinase
MAKAIIYTRVSSDKQERENDSLPAQEKKCRAFCDEQGWEAVAVESDTFTGHDSLSRST